MYDDIIALPHHVSENHPPMERADRAKQFMPFASLRGFDRQIAAQEVRYTPRAALSDDERQQLDDALTHIQAQLQAGRQPTVRLRLFQPQPDHPDSGLYTTLQGTVRKLTPDGQTLHLGDTVLQLSLVDGLQVVEE